MTELKQKIEDMAYNFVSVTQLVTSKELEDDIIRIIRNDIDELIADGADINAENIRDHYCPWESQEIMERIKDVEEFFIS